MSVVFRVVRIGELFTRCGKLLIKETNRTAILLADGRRFQVAMDDVVVI